MLAHHVEQSLPGHREVVADVEKTVIETTLKRVGGNQVKASKLLGIHRTTLRKKIEDYGL